MDSASFFQSEDVPSTEFYFYITFDGRHDMDCSFQEVLGLSLKLGIEHVREGGENRFTHRLPTQPSYNTISLKRSLVLNPALVKWCKDAFEQSIFEPKNLKISLLGENGNSLATWKVEGAYPVSWELASLNSISNDLAIETLELTYRHFKKVL